MSEHQPPHEGIHNHYFDVVKSAQLRVYWRDVKRDFEIAVCRQGDAPNNPIFGHHHNHATTGQASLGPGRYFVWAHAKQFGVDNAGLHAWSPCHFDQGSASDRFVKFEAWGEWAELTIDQA